MKRILSLVLAILVYCMSITSVLGALFPTAAVTVSAADNSSKRLKLSSNTTGARYHVDQNGNPVNLFGMARCQSHATEEEPLHGGNVNTLARHYSNYGMNYMRLAIRVNNIIGKTINDPIQLTDAEIDEWIKNSVEPDVKAIIGEGMYVGLDLHMISISGIDDAKKLPADVVDKYIRANYLPILKRLTNYFKNEPMIANVEIWNEPSIGVPKGNNGVDWRTTLRNYFIDVVKELRKIDSTRILMVSDDNAGWGWNINSFWSGYYSQLGNNVVFSSHVCHDQFDAGSNHDYSNYGNNFLKAVANSNNICIFLNEIENEPASSTDQSIVNLCKFFEENKSTYHFAGCLWRPMNDYLDRTRTWGSNGWAARYTGKTLKIDPTRNWFKANGYNSIDDWGTELASIPNNGNEVKAAGTVTSYDAEYAKVKKASGDIIFTKNKYNSTATASRTPTDLAGYEYVIVKLKFASKEGAEKALNASSSSAFISLDGSSVVSFADYKSALQANAEKAKAGELVTLVLPLSSKLSSCYHVLTMKLAVEAEVHFYTIDFATSAYANEYKAANGDMYNVKTIKTYAGPEYTMQGRPWYPQLAVGASEKVYVSHNFTSIKMDITIPDYATLGSKLSWGSSSSLGGGSFTYHPDSDLGLYFVGSGIEGVGVTKTDFINCLNKHSSALSLGKTVSIVFPISGTFIDGSVIESVQFMFAHGNNGYEFADKSISVSNIEFVTNTLFLSGDSEYMLNSNMTKPQLTVSSTNDLMTSKSYDKVRFSIKIPDIVALRNAVKAGSASTVGGGSFSYDETKDLGLYFSGTNVDGVGVTQYELFDLFNQYQEEFEASEALTVTLPLSGRFTDNGLIKGVNIMLSNGEAATGLNNIAIGLSNIEFISNSLKLHNGPQYTMTSGYYSPQLTIGVDAYSVNSNTKELKFDIALENARTLVANMSYGSNSVVGGGSWQYGGNDLGIYFEGTDVAGVGITQYTLFTFLRNEANLSALAEGKTLTATLPISGTFPDTAVITGLNLLVAHPTTGGTDYTVFNNAKITLSNLEFPIEKVKTETNVTDIPTLKLADGPDYTFSGNQWDPQLVVKAKETFIVPENTVKLKFSIKMPDIETLFPLMSWGSKGGTVSSDSMNDTWGGSGFAIYFKGENVTRVGITQKDFFDALNANKTALANGEAVTMEFKVSGEFAKNAKITDINMMVAHDSKASTFSGKAVSISDIEFITDNHTNILSGGPGYTFSGSEYYPQLTVNTYSPLEVYSDIYQIKFDVAIPDYATLRPLMSWGSRGGGVDFDEFGENDDKYGPTAFGIYFDGVKYVGVTQGNLFKAFDENSEELSAGNTVSLTLPISGTFKDGDIITAVKFMVTHGSNAATFAGKAVSISNMQFVRKSDNNILSDGPKYKFTNSAWWPQLTVKTTEPITLNSETRRIKFDIRIPDYEILRPLMSWGSRGGGVDFDEFGENDDKYGPTAFGIYFDGVKYVGVTQQDLYNAFDANEEALAAGKRVTLTLPITGTFADDDVITALNLMVTHGNNASTFSGRFIALSNVELLAHIEGKPVIENVVAGNCLNNGSYDEVIYCSTCGEELSRKTIVTEKSSHNIVIDKAVEPTYTQTGLTEGSHCDVCGEVFVAQEVIPALDYNPADLNCDESVNSLDLIMIKKLIFESKVDVINKNSGDVNGDGNINILDYIAVYKTAFEID